MRVGPKVRIPAVVGWSAVAAFIWLVAERAPDAHDAPPARASAAVAGSAAPPPLDDDVDWTRVEPAPTEAGAAMAAYEP
jgi:hypothetical protein